MICKLWNQVLGGDLYYREFNHVELEMVRRARRKIVLERGREVKPDT